MFLYLSSSLNSFSAGPCEYPKNSGCIQDLSIL